MVYEWCVWWRYVCGGDMCGGNEWMTGVAMVGGWVMVCGGVWCVCGGGMCVVAICVAVTSE